jgi:hypothetical protein
MGITAALVALPFGAGAVLCAYVCWAPQSPIGREYASRYLALCKRITAQPKLTSIAARSVFQTSSNISMREAADHTHPSSAAVRTAAAASIAGTAAEMGYTAYFLQLSESDVRAGRAGCRSWHWGKDVTVAPEVFNPPPNAALCLVDVDMYIDMPALLAQHPAQYLITTFQPTTVALDAGEYTFTFQADGSVEYRVSGGACYKHHIWDYSGDVLVAADVHWWGSEVSVYSVDKRQTDAHHQIISLAPMAHFLCPVIDGGRLLDGNRLQRLNPVVGEFLRMNVATKTGMARSTGRVGSYACATLTASVDDAVAAIARLSSVDLSLAQVRQTAALSSDVQAAAIVDYHRAKTGHKVPTVYPVEQSVMRYQYGYYEPDAKPSVTPFMSPFMKGCYAPDQTRGNDEQCIAGRVTNVANEAQLTPFASRCVDEFLAFLIPDPQALEPVDVEEVHARQDRPSQRALLNRAGFTTALVDDDAYLEAMQKKEAYEKPTDPRNITIIPPVTKLHWSRVIYAFGSILKTQRWYAFSRTPRATALRVAEVCMAAKRNVAKTDANRWDGHVAPALRSLERRALCRAFKVEWHERVLELASRQFGRRGKTKFGVKYELGWSRASGSTETSDFNTMDNAFIAYLHFRMRGLTMYESWDALGVYGGDDGLTADVDVDTYRRAATSVGQDFTIEPVLRNEHGVQFLSRYYSPFVWQGAPDSMCDIRRTLTKFHVTHSLPLGITPLQKLREKCTGLVFCDPNTPLVGPLARLVVAKFGSTETDFGLKPYAALDGPMEDQYPNQDHSQWMVWQCIRCMPEFDPKVFYQWLDAVGRDAADILRPPLCDNRDGVIPPKVPVVVAGVNHAPAPAAEPQPAPEVEQPPAPAPGRKGRRKRAKGGRAAAAAPPAP